jgi:Fe-S cluster assembly scaffold protein SufB
MRSLDSKQSRKNQAKQAALKQASLGTDIDLGKYVHSADELPYQKDPSKFSSEARERMLASGIVLGDKSERSGTILQMDHSIVHNTVQQDDIEVMSINQAIEKYEWLDDYLWKAVSVDTDKYTAHVELNEGNGYFIRALAGSKTLYPVQACLYLARAKLAQNVHNIIIAEENSELHIITGCTAGTGDEPGLHLGVSEFYVKKGAHVSFTMIHNWTPEIAVRPRTGVIVEEDGVFLSNYVIMKPVNSLQTNPIARCIGENAVARFNSIVVSTPGSNIDMGSRVILDAKGARTEIISRAITTGGAMVARGYIEGNAPDVKGHLECRGLIMKEEGVIHAIPELKGTLAGIDLSHEAAVGKIAEEEVEYLMIRGLTRDEAIATIVRGFLHVDIEGLPPQLNKELQEAVKASEKDIM